MRRNILSRGLAATGAYVSLLGEVRFMARLVGIFPLFRAAAINARRERHIIVRLDWRRDFLRNIELF
jgi:hypothetical protein